MMSRRKQAILDFLLRYQHISWNVTEVLEGMEDYHDEISWTRGTVSRILRELVRGNSIRKVPRPMEYRATRKRR